MHVACRNLPLCPRALVTCSTSSVLPPPKTRPIRPHPARTQRDSSHIQEQAQQRDPSVVVNIPSDTSNATFASWVCSNISTDTSSLTISSDTPSNGKWLLPSCVGTASTVLSQFIANNIILSDWRHLAPSVDYLSLQNSRIAPNVDMAPSATPPAATPTAPPSSANVNGFKSDGTLDWPAIFNQLPLLIVMALDTTHVDGSLPPVLPASLQTFVVSGSTFTGVIPPSLFSQFGSASVLIFDASGNQISGSIPDGLFSGIATSISNFEFTLDSNQLTGPLPDALLTPLATLGLNSFKLSLASNSLSGPVASGFFPSFTILGTFEVSFSGNSFEGDLPSLSAPSYGSRFTFRASHAGFEGPLPMVLLGTAFVGSDSFLLDLSYNALSGTITSYMFTDGLTSDAPIDTFSVNFNGNDLSGTIPENLFWRNPQVKRSDSSDSEAQAGAGDNTGTEKRETSSESASPDTQGDELTWIPNAITFTFDFNRFTGTIPELLISTLQANTPTVSLSFEGNLLEGSIPTAWQDYRWTRFSVAANTAINGSIPDRMLNGTYLAHFYASRTSLTGVLPKVSGSLLNLELAETDIDFCSSSSSALSAFTGDCTLADNAGICDCYSTYSATSCALPSCPGVPTVPMAPIATFNPNPPILVPNTPPTRSQCNPSTRPSLDFVCVDSKWTASSVFEPVLTIPSNAGVIIIDGNLTSNAISFRGTASTVFVTGCITNLATIDVTLDPSEIKALDQAGKPVYRTLVDNTNGTAGNSCPSTLSSTSITSKASNGGCKKVKSQKQVGENGKVLGAYFSIDSSSCKTWWIILVSVVAAVIVIAVIVIVLLVTLCKPLRRTVRPYEQSEGKRMN